MRKAKEDLPFQVEDASKGVSTILINKHNWTECIIKTDNESFDYLPAGPHPPNPSELLLNGAFDHLLANLKSKYDFIVMDTPPVGLVTDGVMVMKKSDVSIYVFRANYSKKEFINNLSRLIKINKLNNVAAVVNALPVDGKAYGYGYYEEGNKKGFLKKLMNL
jgi:capsular exopolysaccharide synthesis family protein